MHKNLIAFFILMVITIAVLSITHFEFALVLPIMLSVMLLAFIIGMWKR